MEWNLIGHDWASRMLQHHISNSQLRHAYLITGPRGVGKRSLALQFAMAVNCSVAAQVGGPCGQCRDCQQIQKMQHPDLFIVQAEAEGQVLKVEQVRELQHHLSLAPYQSSFRIGLLLRMEEANESAQNALLKTLEEPNDRVILLLTAETAESVLPTISSRCEVIPLRPLPLAELTVQLQAYAKVDAQKAEFIAHLSGGRPGYALQLLQEPQQLEKRVAWLDDLASLLAANRRDRFAYCERNFYSRKEERSVLKERLNDALTTWLSFWRDVLITSSTAPVPLINLDRKDQISRLAQTISLDSARQLTRRIESSLPRLANANLRLLAESIILEWPHLS
jgi:DNA polymerase III subunit delta'